MEIGYDYPGISVVSLCFDNLGEFFLAMRTDKARDEHYRWDVCAGALEFSQTVIQTVHKELAEEFGAKAL